jgi:hypothetical protein
MAHYFTQIVDAVPARVIAPSRQEAQISHRSVAKKSGMANGAAIHGIL